MHSSTHPTARDPQGGPSRAAGQGTHKHPTGQPDDLSLPTSVSVDEPHRAQPSPDRRRTTWPAQSCRTCPVKILAQGCVLRDAVKPSTSVKLGYTTTRRQVGNRSDVGLALAQPICRDAPRVSGPRPDTGAALDVVPRGAEVRSSSGHENRGPASHRACVRCGWTDGLAGTAALTGGIRRRRGTETLGMRTCQLAAGRYGPAGCSRGSGGL